MIIICIYKLFIIVEMRENEIIILKTYIGEQKMYYIYEQKKTQHLVVRKIEITRQYSFKMMNISEVLYILIKHSKS